MSNSKKAESGFKNWINNLQEKIVAGKIEIGMNKKQVRTALGNPDVINNTSSRQNISQQWIYGRNISNKKYWQAKLLF